MMKAAVVLLTVALAAGVVAKPKFVSVNMFAKWQSTSMLAETSEFLYEESPSLFWQFLDRLAARTDLAAMSDREQYSASVEEAQALVAGTQSDLLRLYLSLRAGSPAVQMNDELSRQRQAGSCQPASCAWAVLPDASVACSPEQLAASLAAGLAGGNASERLYRGDKTLGPAGAPPVLLYCRLGCEHFGRAHSALAAAARAGRLRYVFRHLAAGRPASAPRTRLAGFGVELAIKSQEYKAMDDSKVEASRQESEKEDEEDEVQGFRFSKLKSLHPKLSSELNQFKQHLLETSTEIAPLKAWQLQDLSFQAAQRAASADGDDALQLLRDASQNYPLRAMALSRTPVDAALRAEVEANQRSLQQQLAIMPGASLLLVNGRAVDLEFYDVFTMLHTLSEEAGLMDRLGGLGLSSEQVSALLLQPLAGAGHTEQLALDFRDPAVLFVNDMETGQQFAQWPRSLQELLKPAFPGTMRRVARNLFNIVLFVDPASKDSADLIRYCEAFVQHGIPIRIGLVWAPQNETGEALVRAFNYVRHDKGSSRSAVSFLTDIYSVTFEQGYELTTAFVKQYFKGIYYDADAEEVLGAGSDYEDQLAAGRAFFARSGLASLPAVLVNGILQDRRAAVASFEETVLTEVMRQTTQLQQAVVSGQLQDSHDVTAFINEQPNVVKRLNQRLLSEENSTFLDFGQAPQEPAGSVAEFRRLPESGRVSDAAARLRYFVKSSEPATRPVSLWLACDLLAVACRRRVYDALRQVKQSGSVRVSVLHAGAGAAPQVARALHTAAQELGAKQALNFATKLAKEEQIGAVLAGGKELSELAVHGMDWPRFRKAMDSVPELHFELLGEFAREQLGWRPGHVSVVANGRLLGPFAESELEASDLVLLERLALSRAGRAVAEALGSFGGAADQSEMAMRLSCLLLSSARPSAKRLQLPELLAERGSVLSLPPAAGRPHFDVVAILDPLSRDAQKMSHILLVLRQAVNAKVTLVFNCRDKLSEPPLNTFYRYALTPEPAFSANGSLSSASAIVFNGMPTQPVLTLGLDTPHNWMVEAETSPHDLDNIKLAGVSAGVHADYGLEFLLVEGHCVDSTTNQIPRGLQFTLGTSSRPLLQDTIVMYNLGYFQLKAAPSAWLLRLRDGKSADIYTLASHDNTDAADGEASADEAVVVVNSFRSKVISVKVAKKSDKLDQSVLGDEPDQASLWGSISNAFSSGGTIPSAERDATLNIFSVASGHLYERFLRIMMLSVLKNTKSRVKFWFLKSFLSPSFIKFIPYYAQKYNFDYALVQYKWPRWLNRQTEKQRIIWAYKILFLDVLFPLDVKRIIFVDADQIVRTDMQELADMDIKGAPYAYTPFCNSRQDMEGFRFWKLGYWANHLGSRPYHISALYLVDLVRFRRLAAGDRLRGQYQGLSQDPNSLANLDQDLPNYMIHQVSIFSLPQEWLYCDTWCDQATKKFAKTIDLCNNPKTKEPKLQAAQRIVPEWKEYDEEIRRVWDEFQQQQQQHLLSRRSASEHTRALAHSGRSC